MVDFVVEWIADFIGGLFELVTEPWVNRMHKKWKSRNEERKCCDQKK